MLKFGWDIDNLRLLYSFWLVFKYIQAVPVWFTFHCYGMNYLSVHPHALVVFAAKRPNVFTHRHLNTYPSCWHTHSKTRIHWLCPPGLSVAAGCPQVLVVFVKSLIAQVSGKWQLRVWLANELPGRGSVVSWSNTGLCSLIKVTYLQRKMPLCDVMTKGKGRASISLAIKRKE